LPPIRRDHGRCCAARWAAVRSPSVKAVLNGRGDEIIDLARSNLVR
jgi:hypothetical protein